jgi:hypothetical protein
MTAAMPAAINPLTNPRKERRSVEQVSIVSF